MTNPQRSQSQKNLQRGLKVYIIFLWRQDEPMSVLHEEGQNLPPIAISLLHLLNYIS